MHAFLRSDWVCDYEPDQLSARPLRRSKYLRKRTKSPHRSERGKCAKNGPAHRHGRVRKTMERLKASQPVDPADWEQHRDLIGPTVMEMRGRSDFDSTRHCIEYYRSQRELQLMVPIR